MQYSVNVTYTRYTTIIMSMKSLKLTLLSLNIYQVPMITKILKLGSSSFQYQLQRVYYVYTLIIVAHIFIINIHCACLSV